MRIFLFILAVIWATPASAQSALTVSAWFNASNLSTGFNPRLVANSHTDFDLSGFQLMYNNGGATGFFDVGNGSSIGTASWSQQLVAGNWYHYVGVYDGANVIAYLNGVQVASVAFVGGTIAAGTGPDINVARNPTYTGDYFNGAIYDVRIYEQALTAAQVLTLYQQSNVIQSVSIDCTPSCSYTSGATSGTAVGNASAVYSLAAFSGTWGTSGTDATKFTFSGNQLQTNGTTPTCASTTTYNLNIVATQSGAVNSPDPKAITVTCNPTGGSIACDIGPNFTGTIPTPAQEAGFTHCVANLDWSAAQFTNTATWLSNCGASSPIAWFFSNYGVPALCADAQMVDDTANGGNAQTLQLSYIVPTDWNRGSEATWMSLSTNVGDPHPVGLTLFPGYYVEFVMRITSASWNNSLVDHNAIIADVWAYPVNNSCNGVGGVPTCDVIMEMDFLEFQGNPSSHYADAGTGWGLNANSFNSIYSNNQNAVSYNTFGFLNTTASSGSPNFAACWFSNGTNITTPCRTSTLSSVDLHDYNDIFPGQVGPQHLGNACDPGGATSCEPKVSQIMLEKRFQVWACSGYKTGPCFGSLVTNP